MGFLSSKGFPRFLWKDEPEDHLSSTDYPFSPYSDLLLSPTPPAFRVSALDFWTEVDPGGGGNTGVFVRCLRVRSQTDRRLPPFSRRECGDRPPYSLALRTVWYPRLPFRPESYLPCRSLVPPPRAYFSSFDFKVLYPVTV